MMIIDSGLLCWATLYTVSRKRPPIFGALLYFE